MGFDEFKKYHNANYHDGDSHFDERIYKKSNGDDFDCSFVQDCYDHFEAGAASRQAEVDKLKQALNSALQASKNVCLERDELKAELKTLQEMHDATCLYTGCLFNERDELQKNFDNALKTIEIQQRFLDDADGANKFLTSQVDELQKRIDIVLNKSEDFYNFGDGESAMAFCNEIINILKGKKDE